MNWQEFTEGPRRREALLSKITVFLKSRAETAQEWDTALFGMSISFAELRHPFNYHSVHCWHFARSLECLCLHAYLHNYSNYQYALDSSTLVQQAKSRLVANGKDNAAQNSFAVLKFFISLSERGQRATELSSFIFVYVRICFPLCCIDTCSAESITGSGCCSRDVPQTPTCTTPLGLYAQLLCHICQSETRGIVLHWLWNS